MEPAPRWNRHVGLLLTLGAIAAVEALSRTLLPRGHPLWGVLIGLVLAALLYAVAVGDLRSGVASAVLGVVYAFLRFATRGDPESVVTGTGLAVVVAGLVLLVGWLRVRADRAAARAIQASREALDKERRLTRVLKEANESLEAFSYVVSHDLKEPVRALQFYAQALEEDHGPRLPEDARDLVHRSRETSRRLARLLEGLLEYSRASRLHEEDLRPMGIDEVLKRPDFLARVGALLEERGGRLDVTPGPPVLAIPVALAQALGNLVLNALRHNPSAAPRVEVSSAPWAQDARFVEVVVRDNGPGFPAPVLDAFNRHHDRPGRGFGLLIARRAVERMGGRMWLANPPEGGAEARVLLQSGAPPPREPESAAADARKGADRTVRGRLASLRMGGRS